MKPVIKHPATHKPVTTTPTKSPEPIRRSSSAQTKSSKNTPSKKDAHDFKRLMTDPNDRMAEFEALNFHFADLAEEKASEPEAEQHSPNHPFTELTPDLMWGIQEHETLPAEFSMWFRQSGDVTARLTPGDSGETMVTLGFQEAVLPKMIGIEKEAERLLSKRMGKAIRLKFKRIDAL
ncbi:hypothetical protein F3J37_01555 [Pantoea sp. Al-1710]|uniref:Uncharacterized protein n=1 Tax=Candidatus Pantoea communis TaxID=2608354 RepID=A0ABX0RN97_9GAMM|nr:MULTISPECIES: hypothetical protein [Pantoea]NIG12935.1 hypothetical protein [Pantoea sp. Cy-640]NIG17364.1 hypothetical protein [Pantoea communis]